MLEERNKVIDVIPYKGWTPVEIGIYSGMPSPVYHKTTHGLSRSIAEKLVFKSPLHAKEAMDAPREPTKFMEMGTLIHCGTLEPELLERSYYVRPNTRPAEKDCSAVKQGLARPGDPVPWDAKAGFCKMWNAAHADRSIITIEDEKRMKGCIGALKANPIISGMLRSSFSELSVFAKWDDVMLKCRPDLIATDAIGQTWVLDIKKCQDASFFVFQGESRRVHRDFQEAWYRFVLGLAGINVDHFVFAGVEEEPPHGVGIYRISPLNVEAMMPKVHQAIDLWFHSVESGEWPGYPKEVIEIGWKP